eukprot:2395372-Pyramimonas_sp.AAC.1
MLFPHMITENSVLVAVDEQQQGHLPTRGSPQDINTTKIYHAPFCSTGDDDSYGLGPDDHGQYVELCFTGEVSEVVLSERQHRILDVDRVATMRVYVTVAATDSDAICHGGVC